ncbi:MAG: DUF2231 domain-containing protein [Deltaproteobacteria bacterium]|nr:DUF2231 domain-containing protein [Deltaproteobacteria bacterium]
MESLAPFHFQFVHFPIALTFAGLLFALLGYLRKSEFLFAASRYTLYVATLGAMAAATTGLMAEEYLPHSHEGEAHEIMEGHETLGLSIAGGLLLTSILSIFAEKKKWAGARKIVLILLFILSSAVAVTGYLGGRLGHEFGIGIQKEEGPLPATNVIKKEGSPHEHHDHH